jgi:hydrogenase maturation protein HypF
VVLPDLATCDDCRAEIFDPSNRRYQYPFTNCTNCGPRFSIITALPYDRPNTSMAEFTMCPDCAREYADPADRRFHAQPNACPVCGPHVELWNDEGIRISRENRAVEDAVEAVRAGQIVAVKGLGGFHLMVDASDDAAVRNLRQRKRREEKPLALMFPDIEAIRSVCNVSPEEELELLSAVSPIVLLSRQLDADGGIADSIAPGNPYLGAMLPYTPLHLLLMKMLNRPVVATSGNLSDEPICIDEKEAIHRLGGIANLFLVHNRPIVRHVDDSVVRLIDGEPMVLRRARGLAPLPVRTDIASDGLLAVGAHLKNAVALNIGHDVFISQHVGDLETERAYGAFEEVIDHFSGLYGQEDIPTACDLHPGYLSTAYAQQRGGQIIPVQHHYAHVLSCMADNNITGDCLGVSWDGTGYGPDRTVWGGEFFVCADDSCHRCVRFRTFRLPGGEAAIKQPRRAALGLLYELFEGDLARADGLPAIVAIPADELPTLVSMLERDVNCPRTSSVGRLFDAVSSLAGIRHTNAFEGQAAMELEFSLTGLVTDDFYPFALSVAGLEDAALREIDWAPVLLSIVYDVRTNVPRGQIAAKFHNGLVEIICEAAREIGIRQVVLTGGCFQNRYLLERAIKRLREEGFEPVRHRQVPPNDGGIALGQIIAAARQLQKQDR